MHVQRKLMLVFAVGIAVGVALPWAHLGPSSYTGLDHPLFRFQLVLFRATIIWFSRIGDLSDPVGGGTLAWIVVFALAIAAIAGVVASGASASTLRTWRVGVGSYVVIANSVFLVFSVIGEAIRRSRGDHSAS